MVNPDKTDNMNYISTHECDIHGAAHEFTIAKDIYQQITGRKESPDKNVLFYQVRQAFAPGEITPELAHELGRKLAMELSGGNHQFIVCTHVDKSHVHNHILINSTTLDCSRKYNNEKDSAFLVRQISDCLCREHGLSVVEEPEDKGKSYKEWQEEKIGTSWKAALKQAIDEQIPTCESWAELLEKMKAAGYDFKQGKRPSFRAPGQTRFSRIDRLGAAYSADALKERIGNKTLSPLLPKQKGLKQQSDTVKSLFDLETMQGGAKFWAKGQNTKQMAKTLAYLREHDLHDFSALDAKVTAATDNFNSSATEIKALENRIAENAGLQKHITNYARTKDGYRQYQASRHKPQFMEAHRPEILTHEAAKRAFVALNLRTLPKVAGLRADSAAMLEEKAVLYRGYQAQRKEMQELQAIKSNWEKLLADAPDQKRDKGQEL